MIAREYVRVNPYADEETTEFDIAVFAIEGACTLLWPKPHNYLARIDATRAERPADDEWPRELPTLLIEGSAGA